MQWVEKVKQIIESTIIGKLVLQRLSTHNSPKDAATAAATTVSAFT